MMETEIIRKDLIGMGFEAKKEGELLEQRLGDMGEFAREDRSETHVNTDCRR